MKTSAMLAAALLGFAPPAAGEPGPAVVVPTPVPFEANDCLSTEKALHDLHQAVAWHGGVGGVMRDEIAQAFADEWRALAGARHVAVSTVYIWVRGPVTVAEVGSDDCVVTMTILSVEIFSGLLDALPEQAPTVDI